MINPDAAVNDAKLIMTNRQLYDKLKRIGADEALCSLAADRAAKKPKPVYPKFKLPPSEGKLAPSEGTLAACIERNYNTLPECGKNCALQIDDVFQRPVSGTYARILKAVLETRHRSSVELRVLTWLRVILLNYASSGKIEDAQLTSQAECNLYKSAIAFVKKVLAHDKS